MRQRSLAIRRLQSEFPQSAYEAHAERALQKSKAGKAPPALPLFPKIDEERGAVQN
jgi:hypothetical protein